MELWWREQFAYFTHYSHFTHYSCSNDDPAEPGGR
jgi:hypothetical protein